MYLVDTNILSMARKLPTQHSLVSWLMAHDAELHISVITVMEIERGIEKQRGIDPPFADALERWLRNHVESFGNRVLPITVPIARRWGHLQVALGRADNDLPIAATALEHDLRLVTRNVRHFDKTGATVVDPFANG